MSERSRRDMFIAVPVLVALVFFQVARGILPGLRQITSDFPNYYTAARIVTDHRDVARLYDDTWFADQIHSYGMDVQGKFSPFPPATALAYLPLTVFNPQTALDVTIVVNVILLILSAALLARLTERPLLASVVYVLLSGIGLANCLRLGQLYVFLSFLIIAGYYAYTRRHPVLAGIAWGLFVPIKYFPVIFLVYFLLRRKWTLALAGIGTSLLVSLTGVAVLGWEIHRQFLFSVAPGHLLSHFSQQSPYAPEFQSWDSLLHRFFVFDPELNASPLLASDHLFVAVKLVIVLSLAALGLVFIVRVHQRNDPDAEFLGLGILAMMGLLLAPGTATYHFVLLWLPLALVLLHFHIRGKRKAVLVLFGLYAALGFVPYGLLKPFDGRGFLTLLAYPRLFIVLAMFAGTVYFAWNKQRTRLVNES